MTIEYKDQSYFPSAKVRLFIRFEEYDTGVLDDKAPKKLVTKLNGVKDPRATLVVTKEVTATAGRFGSAGSVRFVLGPKGGAPPTDVAAEKSSDNLTQAITGIIPKKASWRQNGVRTADTLHLTIRYIDMPIDPRVIRGAEVNFYLGTVSNLDYAEGIGGKGRGQPGSKEPLNIIPDSYTDDQGRTRTNLRFEGWVDKYRLSMSDGEAVIELECTDHTRSLIKQVRPPKQPFGMKKPLDEAVAEYLSEFPQMSGLSVEYRPSSAEAPTLDKVLSGTSFRPNLGPPPSNGGATGGEQQSVWDYLTDICGAVAHTIRVDGSVIIIQQLSTLLGTGPVPREDDPYQGRNLKGGNYPVRAFIYGRNVSNLTIDREFTRKQPKNVEARSYDPERKNELVARFPEKADQITNSGPGDGKADKNFTIFHAPAGIRDLVTLKEVAKQVYTSQGRQELSVHVKTKNLSSFGGDNGDPDIFDMKSGDPFRIFSNHSDDADGTINVIENLLGSLELNEQFLASLGYTPEFAAAYAKAFTNAGFQRDFKMREMTTEWDADGGVSFDIMGVNYVVARVDKPDAATKTAVKKANAPKPPNPPPKGTPPVGTPSGSGLASSTSPAAGFATIGTLPNGSLQLQKIPSIPKVPGV